MRDDHRILHGTMLPATDEFWQSCYPPNDWNCRCNVVKVLRSNHEETDKKQAAQNGKIAMRGRKNFRFNPGIEKRVFPENTSYLKRLGECGGKLAIKAARTATREQNKDLKQTFNTKKGKVLVDNITIKEVSKGSATDKSYFLKQEIAQNINNYIDKLKYSETAAVDLSHNNPKGEFFKRKKEFSRMQTYSLRVNNIDYIVKFGVFNDGSKHLYCILG